MPYVVMAGLKQEIFMMVSQVIAAGSYILKIILSFIFGVDICSPARFSGKFNRFTMNALVALK